MTRALPTLLLLSLGILTIGACSAEQTESGPTAESTSGSSQQAGNGSTSALAGSPAVAGAAASGAPGATAGTTSGAPAGGGGTGDAGSAGTVSGGSAGATGGSAGATSGAENLALHHCQLSGCTGQWKNDPCSAFDGQTETVTGPGKTWDSALGALAVDLGAVKTIQRTVVHFEVSADPNPGYVIEVSNDGQSWNQVRDVANPSTVDNQSDLSISARYVRLYFKQFFFDPWWMHSVGEIEMWETP